MSEFVLTTADNGYILEYNDPQPTRLVYEGGSQLPPRLMNELLGDVANAIEKGESDKCKITIKVEEL